MPQILIKILICFYISYCLLYRKKENIVFKNLGFEISILGLKSGSTNYAGELLNLMWKIKDGCKFSPPPLEPEE